MYSDQQRILERVGATLIDARSELEAIEFQTRETNELHGEITLAYALCWNLIKNGMKDNGKNATSA
jgi:hypothetical protein